MNPVFQFFSSRKGTLFGKGINCVRHSRHPFSETDHSYLIEKEGEEQDSIYNHSLHYKVRLIQIAYHFLSTRYKMTPSPLIIG
jgi:hypothetical protein